MFFLNHTGDSLCSLICQKKCTRQSGKTRSLFELKETGNCYQSVLIFGDKNYINPKCISMKWTCQLHSIGKWQHRKGTMVLNAEKQKAIDNLLNRERERRGG